MVGIGILLGVLGFIGKVKPWTFLTWLVVMSILGMYDFNLWLIDYGSNLDPKAIMSFVDSFRTAYRNCVWRNVLL